MTSRPKSVLCAGRLYCDLVFSGVPYLPEMGKEVFSENLSLHAGGGAFITAATLQSLGHPAALLATLPAAPFAEIALADIRATGIDARLCAKASGGASPQLTVAITGREDRAFLTHKTGVAMPETDLTKGSWSHLHIGELRSLVEHPHLVPQARAAGMTISLDCGWDDALLARGDEMEEIISQVDVFLPNQMEFDQLRASGMTAGTAETMVVKQGHIGARALQDGTWTDSEAHKVDVLDATGAGDTFNGGFLAAWLADASLRDCLAEGNRCGAVAVQKAGGIGGLQLLQNQPAPLDQTIAS